MAPAIASLNFPSVSPIWIAVPAALVSLAVLLAVYVSMNWLRYRITRWRQRETLQQRDARVKAYTDRLLSPKSQQVEQRLGLLLPRRLLALYEDTDAVLMRDFEVVPAIKYSTEDSFWIGDFWPLDVDSLKNGWDMKEFGKGFCFASDGFGNCYWVPVNKERQHDTPVYFLSHDPWENLKAAESLEEFLSWPRRKIEKHK